MTDSTIHNLRIREINPGSKDEITLVAQRMRLTLVERVGEERAIQMYSMDQLVDRVHWHLDPKHTNAKVWVIEDASGQIVAHAIARIERDEDGGTYGYFSTVYVAPEQRSQGLATRLLLVVEGWFRGLKMPRIIYNTAADHDALIRLFGRYGYRITHREGEMVQLTKDLRSAP